MFTKFNELEQNLNYINKDVDFLNKQNLNEKLEEYNKKLEDLNQKLDAKNKKENIDKKIKDNENKEDKNNSENKNDENENLFGLTGSRRQRKTLTKSEIHNNLDKINNLNLDENAIKILKQIENIDINNINNKKSSEIFSKPPLLFKKDKSLYKGSFNLKGKKEGFGILIDSSGNKYIGEWKNDLFHGKGILISINGDFYQGNFISGRIEVNGIYYLSKNKYNYTGDFYNNKFDGKGKIIYEKNDTNNIYNYYEGDFSVGYMHGEGNLFFTDGSYYKGDFDKNYFEGDGTFIFKNGRK